MMNYDHIIGAYELIKRAKKMISPQQYTLLTVIAELMHAECEATQNEERKAEV